MFYYKIKFIANPYIILCKPENLFKTERSFHPATIENLSIYYTERKVSSKYKCDIYFYEVWLI